MKEGSGMRWREGQHGTTSFTATELLGWLGDPVRPHTCALVTEVLVCLRSYPNSELDPLGQTGKIKSLLEVCWHLVRFLTSFIFCGLYTSTSSLHLPVSLFHRINCSHIFFSLFSLHLILFSDAEKFIKTEFLLQSWQVLTGGKVDVRAELN